MKVRADEITTSMQVLMNGKFHSITNVEKIGKLAIRITTPIGELQYYTDAMVEVRDTASQA